MGRKMTIRLSVAAGLGLVLTVLALATLVAAAGPTGTDAPVDYSQSGLDLASGQAGLPEAVLSPTLQGAITSTDTSRPDRIGDVFSMTVSEPPLPAWAEALLNGDGVQIAQNEIAFVQSATGAVEGDFITYSLAITNLSTSDITETITVLDVLPRDIQGNLQVDNVQVKCLVGACRLGVMTITVPTGRSDIQELTYTNRITWEISSLASGQAAGLEFSVRPSCQPAGTVLVNRAVFQYSGGGGSSRTDTTIRARVDESGGFAVSAAPAACSTGVDSANGLDVGDFDGDGDLDLAVASGQGTYVYRHDGNQLVPIVVNTTTAAYGVAAYGVAVGVLWADFNNDGRVDLLQTGYYTRAHSPMPNGQSDYSYTGLNFLHYASWDGQIYYYGPPLSSSDEIVRAAAADYTGDGFLDLATANDYGGCVVIVYRNGGSASPRFRLDWGSGDSVCLLQGHSNDYYDREAYSVAWGDYDNDGDPDLAVGHRYSDQGLIWVFTNTNGTLSVGSHVEVTATIGNDIPTDLAWGDYDGNGYLDLAAGFRSGAARVYANSALGLEDAVPIPGLPSTSWGADVAVDWADVNGDGRLELLVGESNNQPKIYRWTGTSFEQIATVPTGLEGGITTDIRGFDYDNDGDMDIAVAQERAKSQIFITHAPRLATTLTSFDDSSASSAAWGSYASADAYGYYDYDLDLLFGAGPSQFDSRLYKNNQGEFSSFDTFFSYTGPGPQSVAFGDVDGDRDLDIAFGSSGGLHVYYDDNAAPGWDYLTTNANHSVAWADCDGDGDLDLLAGNNGPNTLFLNQGTRLAAAPSWTSTDAYDTQSVAWGDYNNDLYLDFAAGNADWKTQVYRNNKDHTFSLAWESDEISGTRSVAWGDWDNDGDLDLAVGNYDGKNLIYENQNGTMKPTPVWKSDDTQPTTSVAWGDWDNDTDFDLAVGNDGEADRVYENLNQQIGTPQLVWRWTSDESGRRTTGLAWGDRDGDGDLDLAVSQEAGGNNGFYENSYVSPSHLTDVFTPTILLPNNPSYVSLLPIDANRPKFRPAYFYFTPDIATLSPIYVGYRLFDPDGTRAGANPYNPYAGGDDLVQVRFEYSLDGGGTYTAASPTNTNNVQWTQRTYYPWDYQLFVWDAEADHAISDNALFRITVGNHVGSMDATNWRSPVGRSGLNQRGLVSAVSPPFRVRLIPDDCAWPRDPIIHFDPPAPEPGDPIDFFGEVTNIGGSGNLTFTWTFGDGSVGGGQGLEHTYAYDRLYGVTLSVTGDACPIAYEVVAHTTIAVGKAYSNTVYLPMILKSGGGSPTAGGEMYDLAVTPGAPTQVNGLLGKTQLDAEVTHLTWSPNPPEDGVLGYRVYRSPVGVPAFRLLAEVPAEVTSYTDNTAACGQMTFVTAYNAAGESLPSTSSYFSQPCQ